MFLIIALNLVLILAVLGAVVGLLGHSIFASRDPQVSVPRRTNGLARATVRLAPQA